MFQLNAILDAAEDTLQTWVVIQWFMSLIGAETTGLMKTKFDGKRISNFSNISRIAGARLYGRYC